MKYNVVISAGDFKFHVGTFETDREECKERIEQGYAFSLFPVLNPDSDTITELSLNVPDESVISDEVYERGIKHMQEIYGEIKNEDKTEPDLGVTFQQACENVRSQFNKILNPNRKIIVRYVCDTCGRDKSRDVTNLVEIPTSIFCTVNGCLGTSFLT